MVGVLTVPLKGNLYSSTLVYSKVCAQGQAPHDRYELNMAGLYGENVQGFLGEIGSLFYSSEWLAPERVDRTLY